MKLDVLIGFLMSFPAYVSSQTGITESGGGIKRPEETVTLTCSVSGFSVGASYMDWVRLPHGKRLQWIGRISNSGTNYYNSALQNRISVTRDTSKNQVFLQLRSLKPEDTAVYYCTNNTQ
uniref:Ig-like domain-containing protein n=1 Tax=Anolis carolinensis TaxID=28377 RepID=A0A803TMY7_ANOCA